ALLPAGRPRVAFLASRRAPAGTTLNPRASGCLRRLLPHQPSLIVSDSRPTQDAGEPARRVRAWPARVVRRQRLIPVLGHALQILGGVAYGRGNLVKLLENVAEGVGARPPPR